MSTFDVIVVGSGFGGGTAALRLAQAGKRVCVLERGRRWRGKNLPASSDAQPSTQFPEFGDRHLLWGRQFLFPTRQRLGLVQLRLMRELFAYSAAGLGGGSLIWSNVVVKPLDSVFEQGWPRGMTRQALEPYYARAAVYLKPSLVPGVPLVPDLVKGRRVARAELHHETAAKLGYQWAPAHTAVHFGDEVTPHSLGHGKAKQMGCNYCGLCNSGCPQGAKNQIDLTYIAEAEALGADVRPLHEVTALEPQLDGYRVHYKRYALNGRLVERGHLDARRVVLSLGTFSTNEFLLRARASDLLPMLSPTLGTQFSPNGNATGGGVKPGKPDPAVNLNDGPAITGLIDMKDCVIEDLVIPPWAVGFVGASLLTKLIFVAKSVLGLKVDLEAEKRRAKDVALWGGNGMDSSCGQLKLNPLGMLTLEWPGGLANDPIYAKMHAAMDSLARAQGRTYIPYIASIFGKAETVHPLGGCRMADRPQEGVVDPFGRVFGYPGLYIADGSVVPTALGRNPSFTIAALAERVADGVLSDMESRKS